MAAATAEHRIPAAAGVDASILPRGYLGVVAPLNSMGFAFNPGLGIVYDEVVVLLPAQALVFSFQQHRAAEEVRDLPYDEAATRDGIRIVRLADVERAELARPVTGYRLVLEMVSGPPQRWALQNGDVDEVRRTFADVLGERFADTTR
jgi:hypothetical protein